MGKCSNQTSRVWGRGRKQGRAGEGWQCAVRPLKTLFTGWTSSIHLQSKTNSNESLDYCMNSTFIGTWGPHVCTKGQQHSTLLRHFSFFLSFFLSPFGGSSSRWLIPPVWWPSSLSLFLFLFLLYYYYYSTTTPPLVSTSFPSFSFLCWRTLHPIYTGGGAHDDSLECSALI